MLNFQREVEKYIPAAHDSGKRPTSNIRTLVVHDTEGDTAAGAASWFANSASSGSAHLTGDADHLYRCLRDDDMAWGVADFNAGTLHYEMAGVRAWWSLKLWLTPKGRRVFNQCAYRMARWSIKYDIPPRWLEVADLNAGRVDGITSHLNCSLSNKSSSTHSDPGKFFPRRRFMRRVHYYRRVLTAH